MSVIEFFGLPGSGKTTVSKKLIGSMEKKGYKVIRFADYEDYPNPKALIIRAMFTKAGISFLFHSLAMIVKNRLLFKADITKRVIYCLSFIGFYTINKDCDYIVMDEGIVQGVICAFYDYNRKSNIFSGLAKALKRLKIRFVYVDVEPETASKRIVIRNTPGHGRCDDINDEQERMGILEHQFNNFREFYKVLSLCSKVKRIQQ